MATKDSAHESPQLDSDDANRGPDRALTARLEPFDSYWQAPAEIQKGYKSFSQYYRSNFLPHLPKDKGSRILVVSCGPGYLVDLLTDNGYKNVLGIDSDETKIAHAVARGLNCSVERAFPFLSTSHREPFDAIVCEQELNHLTTSEMIDFLGLCYQNLANRGVLIAYGLNGANPIVGAENLAHNIDHFSTFTEYSLKQIMELAGFSDIRPFPLRLYVFWKNPLNYVGLVTTAFLSILFRACFAIYGKKAKIFTKKIGAVGYRRD